MKKVISRLFCAVCLFLTVSCASVTLLTSAYPEKPASAPIDVYLTGKPDCKYIDIAIIRYDGGMGSEYDLDMVKAEARKVGADGVVIKGSAGTSDFGNKNNNIFDFEDTGVLVVAIKYVD